VYSRPHLRGRPAFRDFTYNMYDYLNFDDATLG